MYQTIREKLKKSYEFVSLIGVLLFALLPLFMFIEPQDYGVIFKKFAHVEIVFLIGCLIAYLIYMVFSIYACSPKEAFQKFKDKLFSYFSEQRHAVLFFIMIIIAVISAFLAPDRTNAFSGNDHRPDGLLMYFCFAALFIFASALRNPKYKYIVVVCYVLSFIAVSLVMIQQFYGVIGTGPKAETPSFLIPLKELYSELGFRTGHFYKGMTGTFYNSNHMGYYIAVCSGVFTGIFIHTKKLAWSIVLLFLMAYSYWVLILNDTFGAYLAVLVAVSVYSVFCALTKRAGVTKAMLPFVLFVCISMSVSISGNPTGNTLLGKNFFQIGKDIKTITQADDKTEVNGGSGRWKLWAGAVDMVAEKPLIGYGPDNFKKASSEHNMKMARSHNEFLELSSAIGVPSALFYYIGIISALIYANIKKCKCAVTGGASVAVLAYFVSGLVGVFLFYTACHLFIMLGLMRE